MSVYRQDEGWIHGSAVIDCCSCRIPLGFVGDVYVTNYRIHAKNAQGEYHVPIKRPRFD
jgi:hypothetical protein